MSATKDDQAGRALLDDVRVLCEATRELCSVNKDSDMQVSHFLTRSGNDFFDNIYSMPSFHERPAWSNRNLVVRLPKV